MNGKLKRMSPPPLGDRSVGDVACYHIACMCKSKTVKGQTLWEQMKRTSGEAVDEN